MVWTVLVHLFSVPNFPLKIGVMTMIAIMLGGTLKINWKDVWKIAFVFMLFIVFQMWLHETIVDTSSQLVVVNNSAELTVTQIILSLVFALFYIGGFILGVFIVRNTNKLYEAQLKELEGMLEEIQKRQTTTKPDVLDEKKKEETK